MKKYALCLVYMFFIMIVENTIFVIRIKSTSFTILFHSLILLSEASEARTRNHAIKSRGLFQLSYSFIKYKDLITLRLKLYSSFLPIIELLAIPSFANLFNNWAEFCKLSRRFGYSLSGFNGHDKNRTCISFLIEALAGLCDTVTPHDHIS